MAKLLLHDKELTVVLDALAKTIDPLLSKTQRNSEEPSTNAS